MRLRQTATIAAVAALCALATGCGRYRAETTLHADGSLDRAIYQPADGTPEAARQAKLWKEITFAPGPDDLDRAGWPDALTMLPAHPQDNGHPYFAAWNHFASVKELPEHVLFRASGGFGLPDGKLERELTRTDLGLVEEFRWRETLTDCVTLADMHKARGELADGAIRFGQEVFVEALGKDYDSSDLIEWLKKEGRPWFDEATDLFFLHSAARKGPDGQQATLDALVACCGRRGLDLTKDGKPLPDGDMNRVLRDFAVNLMAEKVKKDGKPIGRDVASGWLDELNSKDGGRFVTAARKVIDRKYGGENVFGGRVSVLIERVFGLYRLGAPSVQAFQYTMTFPGPVVETNGEVVGDGDKVRWRFQSVEAYPLGYPMEARCLFVLEDARKLIGRDQPLSDRDGLTRYAELVHGDQLLEEAMRRCRKDKTLDPLYEYLTGQKKANPAGSARAEKVLKLLKAS